MKKANKGALLDQLTRYGYVLSAPQDSMNPEEVLKALLDQEDMRLLEGFPVVLAHALSGHGTLQWEDKKWSPGKELFSKVKERWTVLMGLSLLLFRLFGLPKPLEDRAYQLLKKSPDGEKVLGGLEKDFSGSGEVLAAGMRFSAERLKNSFRNYVLLQDQEGGLQEQKDSLEFELRLSELFTPRQKELLAKRLDRKPFSKTEREYYYRVVKKRLKALADERVYQMARKLVFS
ncbi:MAG: hypothetical protein V1882_10310 [Candidatus Omnitrophota bacterium]